MKNYSKVTRGTSPNLVTLHDMDGNLVTEVPCPECKHRNYLKNYELNFTHSSVFHDCNHIFTEFLCAGCRKKFNIKLDVVTLYKIAYLFDDSEKTKIETR